MEKEELNKSLKYFLEGKLSEEKEKKLLDWIQSGEENKVRFLEEQKWMMEVLAVHKDRTTEQSLEFLKKRIDPGNNQKRQSSILRQVASIAAVFLLGIILGVAVFTRYFSLPKETIQVENITVPKGAKTNFTLPDGSLVWLNSGSLLSFPTTFGDERKVTLSGEAFFDVVKNGSPFMVSTENNDIEVMGTSFNVRTFENEGFEATLVSGIVKVSGRNGQNNLILHPGQQAFWKNNGLNVKEVDTELYTSWKDGKLMFVREPFPTLIRKIENWYNVKIDYTDQGLNDLWYTGTIEMETISELMEMVSKSAHVSYSFDRKTRIIKIKSKSK